MIYVGSGALCTGVVPTTPLASTPTYLPQPNHPPCATEPLELTSTATASTFAKCDSVTIKTENDESVAAQVSNFTWIFYF